MYFIKGERVLFYSELHLLVESKFFNSALLLALTTAVTAFFKSFAYLPLSCGRSP
ncbi:MAG: hypothetical protein RIR39_1588, partial [Pseudomonadota bacterium]